MELEIPASPFPVNGKKQLQRVTTLPAAKKEKSTGIWSAEKEEKRRKKKGDLNTSFPTSTFYRHWKWFYFHLPSLEMSRIFYFWLCLLALV
jgi:hypothetical protein